MIKRIVVLFLLFFCAPVGVALAQSASWVQIESKPDLRGAQASIQRFTARFPNVAGFSAPTGWYSIALGPYSRDTAREVLEDLRAQREIPADSFIATSSAYRSQFWPVGANDLNTGGADQAPTQPDTAQLEVSEGAAADETPREARRSESKLNREERKDLQRLLQWAGYYSSGIDGAFGSGTRQSMRNWQEANGYEPTGVLTTLQRAALLDQYNAILDGMDLASVVDEQVGVEMIMPMGVVEFSHYQSPFAHYTPNGEIPAQILVISQPGDKRTLSGLYELMQTLEIVPLAGERSRKGNQFTLIGENADIISHTEATLQNGKVKGFTLVWPAGDEERRTRILAEMRTSFTRIDGVLDPIMGSDEPQDINLASGLEIRRPKLVRSGFYATDSGAVVTTEEAVDQCEALTLDGETEAELAVAQDGIAILKPRSTIAPLSVASLSATTPRLQSEIAVAGYPYEGVLVTPSITFGTLSDLKGLRGETDRTRLELASLAGDAGGPVYDMSGAVIGMLLPRNNGARQLPENVSFASNAAAISAALSSAGLSAKTVESSGDMAPEDLTRAAIGMTVSVICW